MNHQKAQGIFVRIMIDKKKLFNLGYEIYNDELRKLPIFVVVEENESKYSFNVSVLEDDDILRIPLKKFDFSDEIHIDLDYLEFFRRNGLWLIVTKHYNILKKYNLKIDVLTEYPIV